MASRRMFSKDVVCSDRFLDMPASAQALYFQYGLEADDDRELLSHQTKSLWQSSEIRRVVTISKRQKA